MGNNPINYVDPTGHWAESAWDVISLGMSIGECAAAPGLLSCGSVVVDSAALILPFVPGGAGAILKAARAADKVADVAMAAKAADNAADVGWAIKAANGPTGDFYSVAFQMKLDPDDLAKARGVHFNRANVALKEAMAAPDFAKAMSDLDISVPARMDKAPSGWVWHHAQDTGVMQLVPKPQHTPGSIFWDTLHPGGRGGFAIWGPE